MKAPIMLKPGTPHVTFMHLSRFQGRWFVIIAGLTLVCVVLSQAPKAFAVTPPPDGGYNGGNTAEGDNALFSLTGGGQNTAIGFDALFKTTNGLGNTAVGYDAMLDNTTGQENTAIGLFALESNTIGNANTATGTFALNNNTTGVDNTATGTSALQNNKTGNDNTATGFQALLSNTSGPDNTAMGFDALRFNTAGADNTASGFQALDSNTTGAENTAGGFQALVNNTTGNNNTALGSGALANETTGASNVALGFNAGVNLTIGSNNIDIGANVLGKAGEANTIRIGKQGTQKSTFIAGIFGTAMSGSTVVVNSMGKLGVAASSARFKEQIKPMDRTSEAILGLKPVTFRYKEEVDPDATPQFGLVAEEVEKVMPDLVVHDEEGKPFTVRYDAVNAMLLNEFLKEHHTVAELKDLGQKQQAMIAQQQKQIEALTAGLQKVGAAVAAQADELHTAATQP